MLSNFLSWKITLLIFILKSLMLHLLKQNWLTFSFPFIGTGSWKALKYVLSYNPLLSSDVTIFVFSLSNVFGVWNVFTLISYIICFLFESLGTEKNIQEVGPWCKYSWISGYKVHDNLLLVCTTPRKFIHLFIL